MRRQIYFDNSATTKISEEALRRYCEVSLADFGNPSSLHKMGLDAEKILDSARGEILSSLGAQGASVIFTASGSEANNLAILGRAFAKERYSRGGKIITTDSEHASVYAPLERLASLGFNVVKIPTRGGVIDLEVLKKELTREVILVTMMLVNNETGALYDIPAVSALMKRQSPEALLHVDATQGYMKLPVLKSRLGADMITVSAHKIEGPKGIGALVVDSHVLKSRGLSPVVFGGGQELGLRSGTENVPAVAAFGEAVKIARAELSERHKTLLGLRSYLTEKLDTDAALSEISYINPDSHAPHILNITLPKIKSETMLHYLSSFGIYVSSGSACSSNAPGVSSALLAFGKSEAEADCSLRISFSHRNTFSEVDELTDALASGVARLSRIR